MNEDGSVSTIPEHIENIDFLMYKLWEKQGGNPLLEKDNFPEDRKKLQEDWEKAHPLEEDITTDTGIKNDQKR